MASSDCFLEVLLSQCSTLQDVLLAEHHNALDSFRASLRSEMGETGGSASSNQRTIDDLEQELSGLRAENIKLRRMLDRAKTSGQFQDVPLPPGGPEGVPIAGERNVEKEHVHVPLPPGNPHYFTKVHPVHAEELDEEEDAEDHKDSAIPVRDKSNSRLSDHYHSICHERSASSVTFTPVQANFLTDQCLDILPRPGSITSRQDEIPGKILDRKSSPSAELGEKRDETASICLSPMKIIHHASASSSCPASTLSAISRNTSGMKKRGSQETQHISSCVFSATHTEEISDSSDEEAFAVADNWLMSDTKRRTTMGAFKGGLLKTQGPEFFQTEDSNLFEATMTTRSQQRPGFCGYVRHLLLWCHAWCILEPFSRSACFWEALGFVLICYDIIVIPIAVFDPPDNHFTDVMNWSIRIFWTLDILVSLRTGYVDPQGVKVMSPYLIAKRYSSGQLWFDIILVGLDWMELIFQMRVLGILKSRRVLRLVRIARLKRARDTIERISEFIHTGKLIIFASLFKALIILLVSIHVLACIWWLVGIIGKDYACEPSWIQGMDSIDFFEKYLRSFHAAISFFYGEHLMLPRNQYERIYMVFSLYFCFILQVWFVSSLTTLMTHLEIVSARRSSMFNTLDNYMQDNNVSRRLALKVVRNAKHALKELERHIPEENIELLKFISDPLKIELHYEVYNPTVQVHPFFHCYGVINLAGVKKAFHSGMSIVSFNKGDTVFTVGEKPAVPRMLFIRVGTMQYSKEQMPVVRVCNFKVWLSEAVLWVSEWIHFGTCVAQTDARLLALDAKQFQDAVTSYPSGHLIHYAREFVSRLNDNSEARTDVGEYGFDCSRLMQSVFFEEWMAYQKEYEDWKQEDAKNSRWSTRGRALSSFGKGRSTEIRSSELRSQCPSPTASTAAERRSERKSVEPNRNSNIQSQVSEVSNSS